MSARTISAEPIALAEEQVIVLVDLDALGVRVPIRRY
jgi:5S rRNA maturation endonuclease (ribonuclease M5)